VQFLASAYGALPLSKKLGSREAAVEPLVTWETNIGFDGFLTPASFMGSALFGGGQSFNFSQIEVKLPKVNRDEITVMLWFRSGDIGGRKTLVVRAIHSCQNWENA
jgi:hypothetical protein